MCGLRVTVTDGDAVTTVRGNPDDVWSRGHLCPKGASLRQIHHDPDRLRSRWCATAPVSTCRCRGTTRSPRPRSVLRPVLDRYGAAAVTVYIGNPVAHNLGLETYVGALVGLAGAAGMRAYYTPGTVDQWPLNVVSALLFGGMWNAPIPDLDRTDHLMMLGANPSASQGSMLSAPDIMGRLAAIRETRRHGGGHRPPPHADRATRHRVGADAARHRRPAAVRHPAHAGRTRRIRRPPHLDGLVDGLDERRRAGRAVLTRTGRGGHRHPSGDIRRLAADLAAAESPVLYSRIGACTQEFGTLATWLVFVLNVALGAIDRPGGALFPKAAVWSPMFMKPPDQDGPGWQFGRFRSRVRGAPEVLGQFPISCLAEEIDTPGDGQIRALITVAGNPALSAPGAGPPRRRARQARRDDLRRQLAQRNHPARTCDPARPVAAGTSRTATTSTGCTPLRRA